MTPQLMLVGAGAAGAAVSKFYFGKDWHTAIFFGLATLAVVAVLTIEKDNTIVA